MVSGAFFERFTIPRSSGPVALSFFFGFPRTWAVFARCSALSHKSTTCQTEQAMDLTALLFGLCCVCVLLWSSACLAGRLQRMLFPDSGGTNGVTACTMLPSTRAGTLDMSKASGRTAFHHTPTWQKTTWGIHVREGIKVHYRVQLKVEDVPPLLPLFLYVGCPQIT